MTDDRLYAPAAEQTPEELAYFDGVCDAAQQVRVLIEAGSTDAVDRLVQRLRDKRLNDVLARLK